MKGGSEAAPSLCQDQVLGGCRIKRFLGHGGMGEVYLGEHLALQRPVALKILSPRLDSERYVDRFFTEARMASRIEHPNVVTIHNVGKEQGLCFIVMQYVDGKNLAELLRLYGGPLPWRSAVKLIYLAAKGLQAVHDKKLVHRDVKPSNIMVSTDSRVLLMDFGLVREELDVERTFSREVVGTPLFMSPEQCRGERLDRRSDIFSLGTTAYYLLAGEAPFQGGTHELLTAIGHGTRPRPVHERNPGVPREVSDVLATAMEPSVARRFPSAAAMAKRLRKLLKASLVADTLNWETTSHASALSDTAPVPELELVELLPLETPWEAWREKLPAIAVVTAFVLFLAVAVALYAIFNRGTGPPKAPVQPPELRPGQVYIGAGDAQLGNDPQKLRSFLSAYMEERKLESALQMFEQERQHRVHVPAFWIDKYEVTNAEFAGFLGETGRDPPEHWSGDQPPVGKENHPVVNVRYEDAEAYAAWAGKKLPTREQWMRAFRGDDDRLFPWGDAYEAGRANVGDNPRYPSTSPVANTPRDVSPFGVCNLVGNASEFIRGTYVYSGEVWRIGKGADFYRDGYVWGIGSCQFRYGPAISDERVGFRCVQEDP